MVLRKGKKFNTYTGHTLRNHLGIPGRGSSSGYCGQSVILKSRNARSTDLQVENFSKHVDDGGLECTINEHTRQDVVLYSMNKRKRWLLPDVLAESIADSDLHKDADYGVVMVERYLTQSYRHPLGQNQPDYLADCRAVYESKFCGDPPRMARKAYSFETDLRTKEATRNRREELKQRRQERARTGVRIEVTPRQRRSRWLRRQDPVPDTPEVRYEIIRPKPRNQYPWHSDRQMRQKNRHMYMYTTEHNNGRTDKFEYSNYHRLVDENVCYGIADDVTQPFQDAKGCEWQLTDGYESDHVHREADSRVCLGEFVVKSMTDTCRRRKKRRKKEKEFGYNDPEDSFCDTPSSSRRRYGKGCAIYFPQAEPSEPSVGDSDVDAKSTHSEVDTLDSGFDSDGTNIDHTLSWIDLGGVSHAAVHSEQLRACFGAQYREGKSLPRKISVALKVNSSAEIPILATAVFALGDNSQNSEDIVNLRMRVCSSDLPFNNLHHSLEAAFNVGETSFTLESTMEKVQYVLSSQADSAQLVATRLSPCRRAEVTMETVGGMLGWTFSSGTVEEVKSQLHDEHMQSCQDSIDRDCHSPSNLAKEDSCGICLEALAPMLGEDVKGMALLQCGHWFCEECWVQHVSSRTRMNESKIFCPAFKCESVIDDVTLLSLMPDSLVSLHLARSLDNCISRHPDWRWCPSPKCGRLVRVGGGGQLPGAGKQIGLPVSCECGKNWCSECQQGAHWPATCQQAVKHMERVESGKLDTDKSGVIRSVEVKRCPACDHPMEKNGGCMHMHCRCGMSFCWECLGAWEDHDFFTWPYRCPRAHEAYEVVFLTKHRNSALLRELALENRKLNRHDLVLARRKAAFRLARRMFLNTTVIFEERGHSCECREDHGISEHDMISTYTRENQGRYWAVLNQAVQFANFASEVHALLEYLSVLVAMGPRRLRAGSNGWKRMLTRLMFIVCRMEELMTGDCSRNLEGTWTRLDALYYQGQQCLRDITKTVGLVHHRLGVKGQRPKRSKHQKQGTPQAAV